MVLLIHLVLILHSGAIGAGSTVGSMALGGLGGYALGTLGDKLFGAKTKAGTYGAIGGAIGSVIPVIGTIAGAAIRGGYRWDV